METIIDRVVGAAGHYEGTGDGAQIGRFTATLDVRPLLDGLGAELMYVETGADGSMLHTEHTLLAFDMWSGVPTLYVLCAELRGLGVLAAVGASRFSNGVGIESYELQVDIDIAENQLDYAWWWGRPGDPLVERSRATLQRRSGQ